jgi:hypothetical protein
VVDVVGDRLNPGHSSPDVVSRNRWVLESKCVNEREQVGLDEDVVNRHPARVSRRCRAFDLEPLVLDIEHDPSVRGVMEDTVKRRQALLPIE